jgi:hypothetical protein
MLVLTERISLFVRTIVTATAALISEFYFWVRENFTLDNLQSLTKTTHHANERATED